MAENYQCNVQGPEGEENFGCGTIFESKESLAPRERLCPKCQKDKDLMKQHAEVYGDG